MLSRRLTCSLVRPIFLYDDAINVRIEKNIPHEGGLRRRAPPTRRRRLSARHRLSGISEDDSLIEEAAHELGSDVAYFLHRRLRVLHRHRAELLDHELEAMKKPLVLDQARVGRLRPLRHTCTFRWESPKG